MTKEEIYEHLAKVYLGKKKKKKKQSPLLKVLIVANGLVLIIICVFVISKFHVAGKAGSADKGNLLTLRLGNYPLRLTYNFDEKHPQVENFSMYLPNLDLRGFDALVFSIRGFDGKIPRMLKIALENKKKEKGEIYFADITARWKKVTIPLSEFKGVSDWSNMTRVAFIFEAWNLKDKEGKVLIDDVAFLNTQNQR